MLKYVSIEESFDVHLQLTPLEISIVSLNARIPTGSLMVNLGIQLIPQIGYWRALRESQDSEQQVDKEECHDQTPKEKLVGSIFVHDTHQEQGN